MTARRWNDLQWDGGTGHYEVYYLTLTDPGTGVGFWIRWTMVAPRPETGEEATCSVWFLAMDPHDPARSIGLKSSLPCVAPVGIQRALPAGGGGVVAERPRRRGLGRAGRADGRVGASLEPEPPRLRPRASGPARGPDREDGPVPAASRPRDLGVDRVGGPEDRPRAGRAGDRRICGGPSTPSGGPGRTATTSPAPDGEPRTGTFVDGVSVFVPRFGRTIGPNTPVVARIGGSDVLSTGPLSVTRNQSEFELTGWRFEARAGRRRLAGRGQRAPGGPDRGDLPRPRRRSCLLLQHRGREHEAGAARACGRPAWRTVDELRSDGRAHFEYAQREPIPGARLDIR